MKNLHRRDLLKLSPLALASTAIGHTAFAEAPPLPAAKEAIFNVHTYGATGDGKTVDTPAINKAIADIASKGGGTLTFPAGTYPYCRSDNSRFPRSRLCQPGRPT